MSNYKGNSCGEISKLESKVVYAISRLQNWKKKKGKQCKITGVTNQQVVDYLTKNYCYLDGDIESQVTTALLSCVKSGVVCVLNDGKYRLVGHNSKSMLSNCLTRTSHGSKCMCLNIINLMSNIYPNTCCLLKTKRNLPQCNINKILRKSQRKRSQSKKNKCKLNNTKQARGSAKNFQNYTSRFVSSVDLDSKKALTKKCQNCIQGEPLMSKERLKRHISGSLCRKFDIQSNKFSGSENEK